MVFRLLHRSPAQLGFQANVSGPLTRPQSSTAWDNAEPDTFVTAQGQGHVSGHLPPTQPSSVTNEPAQDSPTSGVKRALSISPLPMDLDESSPALVHAETPTFPLDLSSGTVAPVARVKPRISIAGALHVVSLIGNRRNNPAD